MTEISASVERDRFPTRLLTGAILLTSLVLGWLGWYTYDSYRTLRAIQNRNFRIQELEGSIIHLDEVLTMSARMAALTGEEFWEKRYRSYEPVLDSAIKEVMQLEPEAYGGEGAAQTNAANLKLVEMEYHAFDLVRQGRRTEARGVLFSAEYEIQKGIYSRGMTQVAERLQRKSSQVLRSQQQKAIINLTAVGVSLPILLVAWLVVLR